MMFIKTSLLILVAFTVFACNPHRDSDKEAAIADEQPDPVKPDIHIAKIALDYYGTYSGVLPCADCEGIDTEIVLSAENRFVKRVKYLGKGDEQVFETAGVFEWNEAGNMITLLGDDPPHRYFVGENKLFHLDLEGERITGDLEEMYFLKKTE